MIPSPLIANTKNKHQTIIFPIKLCNELMSDQSLSDMYETVSCSASNDSIVAVGVYKEGRVCIDLPLQV